MAKRNRIDPVMVRKDMAQDWEDWLFKETPGNKKQPNMLIPLDGRPVDSVRESGFKAANVITLNLDGSDDRDCRTIERGSPNAGSEAEKQSPEGGDVGAGKVTWVVTGPNLGKTFHPCGEASGLYPGSEAVEHSKAYEDFNGGEITWVVMQQDVDVCNSLHPSRDNGVEDAVARTVGVVLPVSGSNSDGQSKAEVQGDASDGTTPQAGEMPTGKTASRPFNKKTRLLEFVLRRNPLLDNNHGSVDMGCQSYPDVTNEGVVATFTSQEETLTSDSNLNGNSGKLQWRSPSFTQFTSGGSDTYSSKGNLRTFVHSNVVPATDSVNADAINGGEHFTKYAESDSVEGTVPESAIVSSKRQNDEHNASAEGRSKFEKRKRQKFVLPPNVRVVHGGEYQCTVSACGRTFKSKGHVKYHVHCSTGKKPLRCQICGQGFIVKSHLLYHIRTHTGEKPYSCDLCDKRFNQSGKLKRHQSVHSGEKRFKCGTCDKGVSSSQALAAHQLTHTGERPFVCQICDKRFTAKTTLIRHAVAHTGERPYSCPDCGKQFGLQSSLSVHRKVHSRDRPHHCESCDRRFTTPKDLRRHELTHSGETPFQCAICERKMKRRDNLIRHIVNTHNLKQELAQLLCEGKAASQNADTVHCDE